MMRTSDFPYPVLRNDIKVATGYKEEYNFLLNIEDPDKVNEEYVFEATIENNSSVIKSMLESKKADIYWVYSTNIIRKTSKVEYTSDDEIKFKIKLPIADLQSFDEIKFLSLIIANKDFEQPYEEEFDDGYDLGLNYYIARKDVLAISNDIIFTFNRTGKSIIKIQKSPDLDQGIKVDISNDDYIIIQINPNFKEAYDIIMTNQSETKIPILTTISSSLIYFAMINVFIRLSNDGYSNHSYKRWYKVIKASLSNKNINLEEKIDDLSEDFDINKIYDFVNLFLNNYFEKTIIKCSEAIK